jgi:glutamate synthase domain-containing protein 3
MCGGIAYIYDDTGLFPKPCNTDLVTLADPLEASDLATLRGLLVEHHQLTGSTKALAIVDDWENELRWFVKVMPNGYKKALMQRASKGIVTPMGA